MEELFMEITQTASAGSTEKCDCLITVSKGQGTSTVHVQSKVFYEYGSHIRSLILAVLEKMQIENVQVDVEDMGAFDPMIVARLQAALYRAKGQTEALPWEELYHEQWQ